MKLIDPAGSCVTGVLPLITRCPSFPLPYVWGHAKRDNESDLRERFATAVNAEGNSAFAPRVVYLEAIGYGHETNRP